MNILLQRHRRDGEARQRPYRADHHEPDRQGQFPRAHGARVVDDGRAKRRDRAQIEGAVIFGITAALHGEITLKNGRVEQANFDSYPMLRIDEAPAIEVYIVPSTEPPGGMGEPGTFRDRPRGHQHDFHGDRQAHTQAAGRGGLVEAPSLNQHSEQLTTAQSHPLQYYRPIGATPVRSYLPYSPRRDVR